MTEEHHIEWILLETAQEAMLSILPPGADPEACFCLCRGDRAENAYALCNLHGFWTAKA